MTLKLWLFFLKVFSILLLVIGIGCATWPEYVTPAAVDQNAVAYVEKSGVDPLGTYKVNGLYPSAYDVKRLGNYVDYAHATIQLNYAQLTEQDKLVYDHLKDVVDQQRKAALETMDMYFGPSGLVTLGLGTLGGGILGGVLIRKPGDVAASTAKATEDKLASVTSGSLISKSAIDIVKVQAPEVWNTILKPYLKAEAEKNPKATLPDKVV